MRFNAKKCYILSIRRKSSHFYQLDGEILQQVDSNPYLGLTISEDLQWKTHITNITKKANSSLGFLRRNLKYCSEDCKRLAYIALVRSILEYGAVVWDPYQSRDILAVEKVQRQAARFIKNDYKSRFEGCVTSMLEDLKLPILQQRRLETRLVMLYKVVRCCGVWYQQSMLTSSSFPLGIKDISNHVYNLTSILQILWKNFQQIIQSVSKFLILTRNNIKTHSLLEL